MSVSLRKINVAASNAVVGTRLLFGSVPVTVTNHYGSRGRITLSAITENGAILVRTVNAGKLYAAAPSHVFA